MLIVIEGIDGSGKTALVRGVVSTLLCAGFRDVVPAREPALRTEELAARYKKLKANKRNGIDNARDQFDFFMDDRRDHVGRVVKPALNRGAIVVQDRSYYSTIAYQGRDIDANWIRRMSERIAPKPDLLIIVDVDIDEALERIAKRGNVDDLVQRRETLERARNMYLTQFPEAVIIKSQKSAETTLTLAMAEVWKAVLA